MTARADRLIALVHELEQSERWDPGLLHEFQQRRLAALLHHARQSVAFYADRLTRPGDNVELGTNEWRRLPVLTREDLQRSHEGLRARALPAGHGRVVETRTSGSTGQPVRVLRTERTQLYWEAFTIREHLWHERDASSRKAVIRANGPRAPAPHGRRFEGWGVPFDWLWRCGNAFALEMTTDPRIQTRWLREIKPKYLLTYPTNLDALLESIAGDHDALTMQQVICVGETVTDRLRQRCKATLHAELVASYSSQEVGYMAVQCPDCSQYHVQSESVVLEVLDDSGTPCPSGQVGRVVVTDLHNFAMPLIRYAIGDYAEVGEPCTAGRRLPSLRRILGRRRNMILYPDGRRHWPLTGFHRFDEVAPIRQYQFIQHTREHIEVRLVVDEPLSKVQCDGLARIIRDSLGHPFDLTLRQLPGPLSRATGGKFEEFVCLAR